MDERARIIKSSKNHNVTLKAVLGHFATNHSHINYYIDMTHIKHFHKMTEEAAVTLADKYRHDTVVDTIICLDGCEMIGALMARELAKSEMMSINSQTDIAVIAPEFNSNGQMIFRDNLQHMIADKKIVLLLASATTGKTINRSLECIKYYGGNTVGISAIFSAIDKKYDIEIDSIFTPDDIGGYETYPFTECPLCKEGRRIDAIVNSFGYSKI